MGRYLLASGSLFVVLALAAEVLRPGMALGVAGGVGLAGISYWGIRAGVDGMLAGASAQARRRALVKFFTRHAILAVAGYGMIARLHLDPLGMLLGVSALVLAVCVAAAQAGRLD